MPGAGRVFACYRLSMPDKTMLAPLRLLDVLAFGDPRAWLAVVAPVRGPAGRCGSCWCADATRWRCSRSAPCWRCLFRLIFRSFGVTLTTQVLANGIGVGLMVALAMALERMRQAQPQLVGAARNLLHPGQAYDIDEKCISAHRDWSTQSCARWSPYF